MKLKFKNLDQNAFYLVLVNGEKLFEATIDHQDKLVTFYEREHDGSIYFFKMHFVDFKKAEKIIDLIGHI